MTANNNVEISPIRSDSGSYIKLSFNRYISITSICFTTLILTKVDVNVLAREAKPVPALIK